MSDKFEKRVQELESALATAIDTIVQQNAQLADLKTYLSKLESRYGKLAVEYSNLQDQLKNDDNAFILFKLGVRRG